MSADMRNGLLSRLNIKAGKPKKNVNTLNGLKDRQSVNGNKKNGVGDTISTDCLL
jgi:hypothetical protein